MRRHWQHSANVGTMSVDLPVNQSKCLRWAVEMQACMSLQYCRWAGQT